MRILTTLLLIVSIVLILLIFDKNKNSLNYEEFIFIDKTNYLLEKDLKNYLDNKFEEIICQP